jgi:acetate kinase
LQGLSNIGIEIDKKENRSKEKRQIWQISAKSWGVPLVGKVLVVRTNEELEVAEQIQQCLKQRQQQQQP